jgi:hypothetical protein
MTQPEFTPDVIGKAHKLLGARTPEGEPKVLQDPEHPNIWWVTPSSGAAKRYRVATDWQPGTRNLSWITCTCPHGLNKGGGTTRCYHAAAALLLLREKWAVEDHQANEEIGGAIGCTCGWPAEADFAKHTAKWSPDFVEHLFEMARMTRMT